MQNDTPDTYSLKYYCDNCEKEVEVIFNFGQEAPNPCVCTNCGVTAARRTLKPIKIKSDAAFVTTPQISHCAVEYVPPPNEFPFITYYDCAETP